MYCTVFGSLNPTMMPNVQCLPYLTTFRYLYIICHLWTPVCNVLGYRRHHLICYTCLFTTPLFVTTVSLLHCVMALWCHVSEWSFDLFSVICSVISLQCLYLCLFSYLLCSLFFLCLSFIFLCLCVLSPAPQIQFLCLEKKTPSLTVAFSVASVLQQFGCLGNS
jgi:hypothetical protein